MPPRDGPIRGRPDLWGQQHHDHAEFATYKPFNTQRPPSESAFLFLLFLFPRAFYGLYFCASVVPLSLVSLAPLLCVSFFFSFPEPPPLSLCGSTLRPGSAARRVPPYFPLFLVLIQHTTTPLPPPLSPSSSSNGFADEATRPSSAGHQRQRAGLPSVCVCGTQSSRGREQALAFSFVAQQGHDQEAYSRAATETGRCSDRDRDTTQEGVPRQRSPASTSRTTTSSDCGRPIVPAVSVTRGLLCLRPVRHGQHVPDHKRHRTRFGRGATSAASQRVWPALTRAVSPGQCLCNSRS